MKHLLVVMLMALSFLGSSAQAQGQAVRTVRVRIHPVNEPSDRLEGILVSAHADTFTVRIDGRLVAIPADSIKGVEISEGTRHYLVRGAPIGAVLGGLIYRFQPLGCDSKGGCGAEEATQGALQGAGVSGAIGYLIRGDRWDKVEPETLHTPQAPSGSRLRIQARITNGFGFSARLLLGGGS